MSKYNLDTIVDQLCDLTLMQSSELVKKLEERLGISAASLASFAPSVQSVSACAADSAVEEKTEFDIVLSGFDPKSKINVIKEVRTISSLGLKEAKDLVEACPKSVKSGVSKAEAEEIKKKLEAVSATVEIR